MAGELIIPESCGVVTSSWLLAGKANPITTTMGIRAITATDYSGICDEIYEGWTMTGGYCAAANMGTMYTFEGVTMAYNNAGVMEGYSSTGPAVVGTNGGTGTMIVSSTLIVQKHTSRIGRHFRGRGYWPLMDVGELVIDTMGNISSEGMADLIADVGVTTGFWQDSTTWQTVLLHTDTVVTPGYTPITSWTAMSKVGTQRRRLRS